MRRDRNWPIHLLITPTGRHVDFDSSQSLAQFVNSVVKSLDAVLTGSRLPAPISDKTGPRGITQPSFNGVHRRSGLLPSSRRRCRATRFHGRNRSLSRRGGTSFDRCRWCRRGNGLAGSRLSRSASQVGRAQLLSAFLRSGAPVYRARFRRLFNDGRRLRDRLLTGGDRFRFHDRFISAGRRFRLFLLRHGLVRLS